MRTLNNDAIMSEPCPPAFIRTAPPIEPGTPTAHSKPRRPAATLCLAITGNDDIAPTTTIGSWSELGRLICSANGPKAIAKPRKPLLLISMLLPRPSINTGIFTFASAREAACRSSTLIARINNDADPPTR